MEDEGGVEEMDGECMRGVIPPIFTFLIFISSVVFVEGVRGVERRMEDWWWDKEGEVGRLFGSKSGKLLILLLLLLFVVFDDDNPLFTLSLISGIKDSLAPFSTNLIIFKKAEINPTSNMNSYKFQPENKKPQIRVLLVG